MQLISIPGEVGVEGSSGDGNKHTSERINSFNYRIGLMMPKRGIAVTTNFETIENTSQYFYLTPCPEYQ